MRRNIAIIIAIFAWLSVQPIPARAAGASMAISPSSGTYTVGETFTVAVRITSSSQAINAAEGTVSFPADLLQYKSVSKSGSIFSYWTTGPSGSSTRVVFGGGLPTPGYTGAGGTVLRITFLAKKTGKATLALNGARVLANDGLGTNILTGLGGSTINVSSPSSKPSPSAPAPAKPEEQARPTPTLTLTPQEDPNAWYREQQATVRWSGTANRQGVSYTLTQDADTVPDEALEDDRGSTNVTLPSEGVWYFHLRARYENGWSAIARAALRYDATPPEPFTMNVTRDRGETDPSPTIELVPVDTLSGVARITLALDGGEEKDVTSPITLTVNDMGEHTAVVTVYDKAGNKRSNSVAFAVLGYPVPVITEVDSPIVLLERITVHGTAAPGDTVTVFINGESIGAVTVPATTQYVGAGTPKIPWTLTSDRVYRPGTYAVTAAARNADGQESVATDPAELKVIGSSMLLGGRVVATVAVAPFLTIGVLVLAAIVILLLVRFALLALHVRSSFSATSKAIEKLRIRILRGRISQSEIEQTLEQIEEGAEKQNVRRPRRRTAKA